MRQGKTISVFFTLALLAGVFPPAARSYEEMQVPNGGAIKGTVTFTDEVPMRKIIPTKDQQVCGGIREDPQVLVGAANGVIDAVVYLKDIQKGKRWDKPKKTPTLTNHNCNFEPHVQVMPAGMNVAILNSDPILHNTHGFLIKATVFNVAMPKQGMRVERPVRKPGIIRVECDAHGWMLAWIYAADNPYFAMTGKDGTFTIANVPPGDYTMVVWQEYTGAVEIPVTVKPKETTSVPVEINK